MLAFLRGRAIPGIEMVTASSYRRLASIGDVTGWIEVELDGARAGVIAHVDVGLLDDRHGLNRPAFGQAARYQPGRKRGDRRIRAQRPFGSDKFQRACRRI